MRPARFLAVLAAAVVVVSIVAVRIRGDDAAPAVRGSATLLGDSLNVGVEPYIDDVLPHWRISADDRVGRSTPEGIKALRARRDTLAPYVVVSLGTNDPPEGVSSFSANVDRVLRIAGPERCVLWATIWRDGAPSEPFNDVLRNAAEANRRLRLVDWAGMVESHPELLAPDGLHGNEEGYRQRAEAIAEAVESCVPGQTLASR